MLLRVFLSTILFRKNRLSQRFQVLPPALLFRRCASPGLRWRVHLCAAVYKFPPTCCSCTSIFCSWRLFPLLFSHFSFPTVLHSASTWYQVQLAHSPVPFEAHNETKRRPIRGLLPRQAKNGSHRRRATDGNLARNGRAVDVKFLSRSRCLLPPNICLRWRGPGRNQRGCDMEGKQWRVLEERANKRNTLEFPKILWWKCKCVYHDWNFRGAHKVKSYPLYVSYKIF